MQVTYEHIDKFLGPMKNFGVDEHLSMDEYHAHEGVSSSDLKAVTEDPFFKVLNIVDPETVEEETSAKAIGTGIHATLLEPKEFEKKYTYYPGKVRRGDDFKAFQALHPGKHIYSKTEFKTVVAAHQATTRAMRSVEESYKRAETKIKGVSHEISSFLDFASGFKLKCRPDALHILQGKDGKEFFVITDLKTTRHKLNNTYALTSQMHELGYATSAAMYTYLCHKALDIPGYFNILWYSKKTRLCALHHNFAATGRSDTAWDRLGLSSFLTGLRDYGQVMEQQKGRLMDTKTGEEFESMMYLVGHVQPHHWLNATVVNQELALEGIGEFKGDFVSKEKLKKMYDLKYKYKNKVKKEKK